MQYTIGQNTQILSGESLRTLACSASRQNNYELAASLFADTVHAYIAEGAQPNAIAFALTEQANALIECQQESVDPFALLQQASAFLLRYDAGEQILQLAWQHDFIVDIYLEHKFFEEACKVQEQCIFKLETWLRNPAGGSNKAFLVEQVESALQTAHSKLAGIAEQRNEFVTFDAQLLPSENDSLETIYVYTQAEHWLLSQEILTAETEALIASAFKLQGYLSEMRRKVRELMTEPQDSTCCEDEFCCEITDATLIQANTLLSEHTNYQEQAKLLLARFEAEDELSLQLSFISSELELLAERLSADLVVAWR